MLVESDDDLFRLDATVRVRHRLSEAGLEYRGWQRIDPYRRGHLSLT